MHIIIIIISYEDVLSLHSESGKAHQNRGTRTQNCHALPSVPSAPPTLRPARTSELRRLSRSGASSFGSGGRSSPWPASPAPTRVGAGEKSGAPACANVWPTMLSSPAASQARCRSCSISCEYDCPSTCGLVETRSDPASAAATSAAAAPLCQSPTRALARHSTGARPLDAAFCFA